MYYTVTPFFSNPGDVITRKQEAYEVCLQLVLLLVLVSFAADGCQEIELQLASTERTDFIELNVTTM